SSIWAPQVAALRDSYDVVAPDMLGHGGSSLPPADPTLADYAAQLLSLLDALRIPAAHIAGHSMGAL
ncbi:alpha/beta fold hydrolase, partial [Stenotrophomonas maltophilia]|uniref:alpha/beta fold hydrolase n=1 Tax=Stenotrophomonas maltophilia TaxID=40324 RepID=UPI0013DB8095